MTQQQTAQDHKIKKRKEIKKSESKYFKLQESESGQEKAVNNAAR